AQARAFLGDPKLSLAEIGFLLGYATESSFRRAFKRWTGNSPADERQRH
ncbi:MAG: helix-turn-helix domain-containing protein, partial [Nannocystaceae bacterium]